MLLDYCDADDARVVDVFTRDGLAVAHTADRAGHHLWHVWDRDGRYIGRTRTALDLDILLRRDAADS